MHPVECVLKNISNSTRVGYKNVLFGMNYRVNIGCGESGTKEAGFRHRTCGPTSENRDSNLATMCQVRQSCWWTFLW